jgi:hypothetical protein
MRSERATPIYPLLTRDPVSGGELIVTRLECPTSGVVIEGAFSLGWMGKLSQEQLEFVGLLIRNRGNIQKLAGEMNVSYNTARNRLDEVVSALGVEVTPDEASAETTRLDILSRLSAGELSFAEAMALLKGNR